MPIKIVFLGLERQLQEKEELIARTTDNTYHELVGERKEEVRNIERKIDEVTIELRNTDILAKIFLFFVERGHT